MAMKTAWTTPLEASMPQTRDGGDPLGFRACANRLARIITPGLTQTTTTTRGFALLCLALEIARRSGSDEGQVREHLRRFDALWAAANVHQHGDDAAAPGQRRAARILDGLPAGRPYPLDKPVLSGQASWLWTTYRRASTAFGLTDGGAHRTLRPIDVQLTSSGKAMAASARRTHFENQRVAAWIGRGFVSLDRLAAVRTDAPIDTDATATLTVAIEAFELRHGPGLSHLRRAFELDGEHLSISSLLQAELSDAQHEAVHLANELVAAIESIEFTFRAWIRSGAEPAWGEALDRLDAWTSLARNESDLGDLHRRLVDASHESAGRVILAHHRRLANARGARTWRPGADARLAGADVLPDFNLASARGLFVEGVEPRSPADRTSHVPR